MVRPIDISNVLNSLQLLGQSNQRYAELERQKRAKDIASGAGIGGSIGGIIGSVYGGPIGGAAGGTIGSYVGGQALGGGEPEAGQVAQSGIQGYQMGGAYQQQQQNQNFNNQYASAIESNPNITDQQKQYAAYIKGSNQPVETTLRQSQFLGIDPQTLRQQVVNKKNNALIIDRGVDTLKSKQQSLDSSSENYQQEYEAIQGKINRLENIKSQDIGSLDRNTVLSQTRVEVPKETEIYTQQGKILARTTDHLTGESSLISLGNTQEGKQKIYKVPYYENGKLRIKNMTDQEKAINFANKKGSEVLGEGKSILLTNIEAAAKGNKKAEDNVGAYIIKRRDAITRNLTRKDAAGSIPPSPIQVDMALRDEIKIMAETTSGKTQKMYQARYENLDKRIEQQSAQQIKNQVTGEFIAALPQLSPDLETVNANIEAIKSGDIDPNVDKKAALAALQSLKKQYEQAEQKKIEEEQAKKAEEERKQEVERRKREAGYTPVITYKGETIF
jgi:hypothetical protein